MTMNHYHPTALGEAVKISVQLLTADSNSSLKKHFSVDPSLTDYGTLLDLLKRAFDIESLRIYYQTRNNATTDSEEQYLPLTSNADLSVAFVSCLDGGDLHLLIHPQLSSSTPQQNEGLESDWDLVATTEVNQQRGAAMAKRPSSTNPQSLLNNQQLSNYYTSLNAKVQNNFNTTTIFNTMEKLYTKALTFIAEEVATTIRPPLSDVEFRAYLDPGGLLCRPKELRYAVYHGGVEPGLRRVIWKHLLHIYPPSLSGNARIDYIRQKSREYHDLKALWQSKLHNEVVKITTNMVLKDVLRTDRQIDFYSGENNPNVQMLFDLLSTYSLHHPTTNYCQGMSDLASPLLYVLRDEAQAYICFCSLMQRLKPNFHLDGVQMSLKFTHLSQLLHHYDPGFFNYLKRIQADDLLFCYRWLLLELKREFCFDDSLRMMEVMWASVPQESCGDGGDGVELFEVKFNPTATVPSSSSTQSPTTIIKPTSSSSCYSRLRELRLKRRSSSTTSTKDNRQYYRLKSNKTKGHPHSLDESSTSSLSSIASSLQSSTTQKKKTRPFYSLDDDEYAIPGLSTSPFTIVKAPPPPAEATSSSEPEKNGLLIKNLRQFWTIGKGPPLESSNNSQVGPPSTSQIDVDTDSSNNVFSIDSESDSDSSSDFENLSLNTQRSFVIVDREVDEDPIGKEPPQTNNTTDADSGLIITSSFETSLNNTTEEATEEAFQEQEQQPHFSSSNNTPPPSLTNSDNPFLLFLSLTLLLQHRNHVIANNYDHNETAMYFDRLIRKHNVNRVLNHARSLYSQWVKQRKGGGGKVDRV